jgi:hypothetical protein
VDAVGHLDPDEGGFDLYRQLRPGVGVHDCVRDDLTGEQDDDVAPVGGNPVTQGVGDEPAGGTGAVAAARECDRLTDAFRLPTVTPVNAQKSGAPVLNPAC